MNKIQKAAELAKTLVGCPYIFGAVGQDCTVKYRKSVIENREEYAIKITNNCPVLSGKQKTCSGCKYEGRQSFDCRGLTWYVCDKAGLKISKVGATTQWNTDSWQEKGTINKAPLDKESIVFRQDDQGVMQHTGFRLADGTVIDARGHDQGVISANENTYGWTHYAIPYGAYDEYKEEAPEESEVEKKMDVLYKATVVGGMLNLRAAPRTTAVALAYIPEGAVVEVVADVNSDWSQIYYGEILGYVASKFLQRENTSTEPEKPVEDTTAPVEGITVVVTDVNGNRFRHENVEKIEFE